MNPTNSNHAAHDQARELRALVAQRQLRSDRNARDVRTQCRTVVVASGKAGVGRSVVSLNLATALAQLGQSVGLIDANDTCCHATMLCGQDIYWNLSHVVTGLRRLDEVLYTGPNGIRLLPGAGSILTHCDSAKLVAQELIGFENSCDWLIVDAPAGWTSTTKLLIQHADRALIIVTPDPTAITEGYALLKHLAVTESAPVSALINQVDSETQGIQIAKRLRETVRSFLRTDLDAIGFITQSGSVLESIRTRTALSELASECREFVEFCRVAERLADRVSRSHEAPFIQRLFAETIHESPCAQTSHDSSTEYSARTDRHAILRSIKS